MRTDHLESVEILRGLIRKLGGNPSTHSGEWGGVVPGGEGNVTVSTGSVFLPALRQGEASGIRGYEEAIAGNVFDPEIQAVIRGQLLPPLRSHLLNLESLPL